MIKVKILIADDHVIIRDGLKSLFSNREDMEVVGEASDGISIRKKALMLKPDVILMDISMPGLNGMATTRLIKKELKKVHIIGLSVYHERHFILGMLQAGAEGYLVKRDAFQDVLDAIRYVMTGHVFMSQLAREIVFKDYKKLISINKDLEYHLSSQEEELLYGFVQGKNPEQLAQELKMSLDMVQEINSKFVCQWIRGN